MNTLLGFPPTAVFFFFRILQSQGVECVGEKFVTANLIKTELQVAEVAPVIVPHYIRYHSILV